MSYREYSSSLWAGDTVDVVTVSSEPLILLVEVGWINYSSAAFRVPFSWTACKTQPIVKVSMRLMLALYCLSNDSLILPCLLISQAVSNLLSDDYVGRAWAFL